MPAADWFMLGFISGVVAVAASVKLMLCLSGGK